MDRRPPSTRFFAASVLVSLAALAALTTTALSSASRAAAAPRATTAQTARLRAELDQLVAAGVPGAVVLARNGNGTITLAGGLSHVARRTAMRADARFRVGSLTKSFVATVALQLVGENKLSLDDSVERWLPGLVPGGDRITIQELLGHRSGLYDYFQDPKVLKPYLEGHYDVVWKPRQLVAIATAHKPAFAPGDGPAYSNTNYVLLGLIVEAATGKPIGVELRTRIFERLGLNATTFATSRRIKRVHAHGYLLSRGHLQDVTAISPSVYWAAGSIISNANDVARYYHALIKGRLLSADMLRKMEKSVPPAQGYGLGILRARFPCGVFYGHDGAPIGYNAVTYTSADGRRQFVVLTNSGTPDDTVGTPKAQRVFQRLVVTAACG